jgi:hypothetical protein
MKHAARAKLWRIADVDKRIVGGSDFRWRYFLVLQSFPSLSRGAVNGSSAGPLDRLRNSIRELIEHVFVVSAARIDAANEMRKLWQIGALKNG